MKTLAYFSVKCVCLCVCGVGAGMGKEKRYECSVRLVSVLEGTDRRNSV